MNKAKVFLNVYKISNNKIKLEVRNGRKCVKIHFELP